MRECQCVCVRECQCVCVCVFVCVGVYSKQVTGVGFKSTSATVTDPFATYQPSLVSTTQLLRRFLWFRTFWLPNVCRSLGLWGELTGQYRFPVLKFGEMGKFWWNLCYIIIIRITVAGVVDKVRCSALQLAALCVTHRKKLPKPNDPVFSDGPLDTMEVWRLRKQLISSKQCVSC